MLQFAEGQEVLHGAQTTTSLQPALMLAVLIFAAAEQQTPTTIWLFVESVAAKTGTASTSAVLAYHTPRGFTRGSSCDSGIDNCLMTCSKLLQLGVTDIMMSHPCGGCVSHCNNLVTGIVGCVVQG
jgi:hypothetical protein